MKIVSDNQFITTINEVELYIKREDLIHPFISGNKIRKLKYNLIEAKNQNKNTLITFGGAFSNHIAATAYAAKTEGFHSIGIIRGEELKKKYYENPTLQFASENKMKLFFVSRNAYRDKEKITYNLFNNNILENYYIIPEGGTNNLAIKGCQEILTNEDQIFDYITTSVGTSGTICGLITSSFSNQKILGFSSLKGDFLCEMIQKYTSKKNWDLISKYNFGGYGKTNNEFILFLNKFYTKYKIPLDAIYTGKMVYGVLDLIQQNYFPKKTKILMIHTGGLQGNQGINNLLAIKNKNKIEY